MHYMMADKPAGSNICKCKGSAFLVCWFWGGAKFVPMWKCLLPDY